MLTPSYSASLPWLSPRMPAALRWALAATLLVIAPIVSAATYDVDYRAQIAPDEGIARVEIALRGEKLPSKVVLRVDADRHLAFSGDSGLDVADDKVTWKPSPPVATLRYQFVIKNQKASGRYDSYINADWSILRSDKMIPPMAVTAAKGLQSRASLSFDLPEDWSVAAPYEEDGDKRYRLVDPGRGLARPKGWLILGRITSRQDDIEGVDTRVAAPRGEDIRLQDTLAFLNWVLPEVTAIFPGFPQRLLVVSAREPMWLGGLSGTRSLFMHGSRPLVSGNRTSSLIHELVHVASGIRGDHESDWIVEGLAEYYAVNLLYRSGGMSTARYQQTLAELEDWGREADSLLVKRSSGAVTARAVAVLLGLDQDIRQASNGRASLDDVARELAATRGVVSLERLNTLASQVAGAEITALQREALSRPQ